MIPLKNLDHSLDIKKIQAICFDVDGTLRDTDDQYMQQFAKLLRMVRYFLPNKDEKAFARRLVMRIETPANFLYSLSDKLGIDHQLAAIGEVLHHRSCGRKQHSFLLIQGVKEMLDQLKLYFPLAVVSARGQQATLAFLDHFNLTNYFQCIATAQTTRRTKPHPDPIHWAADQIGVPASACVVIGDTTTDIQAGVTAGAQTIGVLCGFGEYDELHKAGANLILPRTPDIVPIMTNNPFSE